VLRARPTTPPHKGDIVETDADNTGSPETQSHRMDDVVI
jgi:hypothetical protein